MKDEFISTEHLLVALAGTKGAESLTLLKAAGTTPKKLTEALKAVRGAHRVTDPNPEGKFAALEKYTLDLTERARQGKIDPVVGRDDEMIKSAGNRISPTEIEDVLYEVEGVSEAVALGVPQRYLDDVRRYWNTPDLKVQIIGNLNVENFSSAEIAFSYAADANGWFPIQTFSQIPDRKSVV